MEKGALELSIVMPCLNEAETLGSCIAKAQAFLKAHAIQGEVIIGDNGSTDGSQEIARSAGAHVVSVRERGYGSALLGAIREASGAYVIMGDSDDSYDFSALFPFVEKLRLGHDLVMGNRFAGGIQKGAMPFMHRYIGNPVLSGIGRLFFRSPARDFHCGLRGFRRDLIEKCNIQSSGMEFASEMVVKATINSCSITEVPITLSPDGRSRAPHLRKWRDGWRHLRFLLLYSPRWLFLIPGSIFFTVGIILSAIITIRPLRVFNIYFDTNTLLYANMAVILGFQIITFAVFTRIYGVQTGFLPASSQLEKLFRFITLEKGLLCGTILTLLGIGGTLYAFLLWRGSGFGPLAHAHTLRIVIPSVTLIILGIQTIFSSFFLSILGIQKNS